MALEEKYSHLSSEQEQEQTQPPSGEPLRREQQHEGNQRQEENQPAEEPPWPTNGGPLGCLLGAMAGVLLGAFLGTTLLIFQRPIGIALTVVLTIGLAVAGWQIGRSIFREYKPPKEPRQPERRQPKKR